MNAQSIAGKINELCSISVDLEPDLILVTETWCNSEIQNAFLAQPDYELLSDLRRDRNDTKNGVGGGLLVFTKNDLKILPIDDEESESFNQYCKFVIEGPTHSWTVYLVYRPPSSTPENNEKLVDLVRGAPNNAIFVGDFNLPGISWVNLTSDSKGNGLLDICVEKNMSQLVNFPTHLKGNTLDLVLTDRPDMIRSVEAAGRIGKSDHEMLLITVDMERAKTAVGDSTPCWNAADWATIRAKLTEIDWHQKLHGQTADQAWCSFRQVVDELVEDYVPKRPWRKNSRPAWMSTELLREIRQKRRLWTRYKRSPTGENLDEFNSAQKRLQKKIRTAKRTAERKLASNTVDSKPFYSYLSSKTKAKAGVGPIKVDGKTLVQDQEMAEELNKYFGSVFQTEDTTDVPVAETKRCRGRCSNMVFRPSQIKKKIEQLKNRSAPGPDGLAPRLLKELVNEVAVPLSIIYSKSMASGEVPEDWRTAYVTPIHKKGPRTNASNYRPVSLTSVPGKIMESMIKDKMLAHLKSNKLIGPSQHGFVPGRSCSTNLLSFLEKATKIIDDGGSIDMVYLDFAKAFDMVPKHRLVSKLKAHGFGGDILRWIENWLSDRKQRVRLNGKLSSWIPVTSGVPQGSVLGPILFVIFINDLEQDIRAEVVLKFADDTKIGQQMRGPEDREILQHSLDKVVSWAGRWGMKFNVSKCHILHLGKNNPKYQYTMSGEPLEVTTEERDLGVLITDNLKVSAQCDKATRTANGVLSHILRTFTYRSKDVLPKIFAQYVRPHLEFAAPVWSPWLRTDIDKMEAVQRRMVAAVTGLKGRDYYERLEELEITTLEDRRKTLDLLQAFKILSGRDDVEWRDWFEKLPEPEHRLHRTRATEGGQQLKRGQPRLEIRRNFFSQRIVEKWNSLPSSARQCMTMAQFRQELRRKHL